MSETLIRQDVIQMQQDLSKYELLLANYKFNPNKPGIFQWQS
ncbi:hypothetical protein OA78_1955, partial [Latilactobacillus curvatus]